MSAALINDARRRCALDELAALLNLPTVGRGLDDLQDEELRLHLRRAAQRLRALTADLDHCGQVTAPGVVNDTPPIGGVIAPACLISRPPVR